MMKVLFLDHDGVMCLTSEQDTRFEHATGLDSVYDQFNLRAIETLNEIIDETDCEIVVSSDWRHTSSLTEMRELYSLRGIRKMPIGFTDHVPGSVQELESTRAQEIKKWLSIHDPKGNRLRWCAIDDLDMSPWLKENFVLTIDSRKGITQKGIKDKVLKILNE